MVGQRYPKIDLVDVVNEPLDGHNPPDGGGGRANYEGALGGKGSTGWDWVIKAFTWARKYLPNAKLLINDYNIINDNLATTSYLQIINLLKQQGLIDGIGVQCHRFEIEGTDTSYLRSNLDRLSATGLPIYVSEMDLGNLNNYGTPDDNEQLQLYQRIFPLFWQYHAIRGVTFWGYLEGQMWQSTCYLIRADYTGRPAFLWLAQYVKNNPVSVPVTASGVPSTFGLDQNFPNPFNPTTNIRYSIVKTSQVTLKVFDLLGRQVRTLVHNMQAPGQYAVTFNAQDLASGVYFYRLQSGDMSITKKLVLMK
jgi:endo-1,4-beta-xylanase